MPTITYSSSGNLREDMGPGTVVAEASLSVVDDNLADRVSFTYALSSVTEDTAGASRFITPEISRNGDVRFVLSQELDFDNPEHPRSVSFIVEYEVRKITVDVAGNVIEDEPYKTFIRTVKLANTAVNDETPSDIRLSFNEVAENAAAGKVIGKLLATDADNGDVLTFSLADDPSGFFEIDGSQLRVKSGARFDFDAQPTHDVAIRVTDAAGHEHTQLVTIRVIDVNQRPTDILIEGGSVKEDAAAGTFVGTLSALDPDIGDAEAMVYTIKGNTFVLDGNRILVSESAKLDFEKQPVVEVTVKAFDPTGASLEKKLTITVENVIDYYGTGKAEPLIGDNSSEEFWGRGGDDRIVGGGGDDIIWGGKGLDYLTGGSGADLFVFKTTSEAGDMIYDFRSGEDKIAISGGLVKKIDLDTINFVFDQPATEKGPALIYFQDSGSLLFDPDGAGGKMPIELAILLNMSKLTADDFTTI